MSQFNVNFKLKRNNMVYVNFLYYCKYWIYQTRQTGNTGKAEDRGSLYKFRRVSQSWDNKDKIADIQIKVMLSSTLAFMLGFKKSESVFIQTTDGKKSNFDDKKNEWITINISLKRK